MTVASSIVSLIDDYGISQHAAKEMIEILQQQYCSVFRDPTKSYVREAYEVDPQHKVSDITFTGTDI